MKKHTVLFFIALISVCSSTNAQNNLRRIKALENKIASMEQVVREEASVRQALLAENDRQHQLIDDLTHQMDSLKQLTSQHTADIKAATDNLQKQKSETQTMLSNKADASDINDKTKIGLFTLLGLLLLSVLAWLLLHKRIRKGNKSIAELRADSEKINEQILNKFSAEMTELQAISSSLKVLSEKQATNDAPAEQDHSLIKTLADRITFMEMTLFKMDAKVRGHKQLTKSIAQMKDNLLANGYEIVDMLGKPYNDGMKVTANFVEDEDLEEGKQIITGIIKPQINYKGKMIQAAQITVSQNI